MYLRPAISFMIVFALSSSAACAAEDASNSPSVAAVISIADGSQCNPNNNDWGPQSYIRGMALVFARSVCQPNRADVKRVSVPASPAGSGAARFDALNSYATAFEQLGMRNDKPGLDVLRHTYVLLLGLGLVESSGQYCAGRQQSAPYDEANSAESGLIQTSWGAHEKSSKILSALFSSYRPKVGGTPNTSKCMLGVFKGDFSCSADDAINYGAPKSDGYQWQALTKACPAFAAEYAAVVLRVLGGLPPDEGEWGPIGCHIRNADCRQPTLYPKCDAMFAQVQDYVRNNPSSCSDLP